MQGLNAVAIAVSQEDTDLDSFGKMSARFEGKFPILADLKRGQATFLDRTTAYLIDDQGVVQEVFPMIIHARPSWMVVADELEKWSSDETK